ncbi:28S ribosomal protein S6, mitochondrial [Exaiptasia diaphana]|uniref:Small ribosomal subunit protein bS6m n=1 Tax=Exaiptasia diaphana TaxID=2652724 RepID=A0A913XQ89_EXADI|nr:28S ribosomal protein S6, mitochondrial [Exaiptasia diaphana]
MPRYELILISRILGREGFAHLLRQTCTSIMDKGGVVRKLENLGQQRLPQRMRAHAEWHHIGRYFLFDFELSTHQLPQFEKELKTDPEVIQNGIVKIQSRFDSKKYEHPILECWKKGPPDRTARTSFMAFSSFKKDTCGIMSQVTKWQPALVEF